MADIFIPDFEVGSKVLVQDESVRRGRSKKLEADHVGSYEVIRIEEPNLVLRTRKNKEMKIHANRAVIFRMITDAGDATSTSLQQGRPTASGRLLRISI
jgi:hypothetical protein